jgi:hypothetical protein
LKAKYSYRIYLIEEFSMGIQKYRKERIGDRIYLIEEFSIGIQKYRKERTEHGM